MIGNIPLRLDLMARASTRADEITLESQGRQHGRRDQRQIVRPASHGAHVIFSRPSALKAGDRKPA
jgi:hypothetical protein